MTPQLDAWKGQFGNAYVDRNSAEPDAINTLTRMWARMLEKAYPASILEIGANVGLNLQAIAKLTYARITAVEPNAKARARLWSSGCVDKVVDATAFDLPFADEEFELSFTSGVLIHVHPDDLFAAVHNIARVSSRYILCCEYFSPEPREIPYRGQMGMLWTRDYGRFYLESVPGLKCIDHGFHWTGAGALDDMNWWLFEKGQK